MPPVVAALSVTGLGEGLALAKPMDGAGPDFVALFDAAFGEEAPEPVLHSDDDGRDGAAMPVIAVDVVVMPPPLVTEIAASVTFAVDARHGGAPASVEDRTEGVAMPLAITHSVRGKVPPPTVGAEASREATVVLFDTDIPPVTALREDLRQTSPVIDEPMALLDRSLDPQESMSARMEMQPVEAAVGVPVAAPSAPLAQPLAATAGPPSSAPSPTTLPAQLANIDAALAEASRSGGPVRFHLTPRSLGTVHIEIVSGAGGATVVAMAADSEGARDILAQHQPVLQHMAERAGWAGGHVAIDVRAIPAPVDVRDAAPPQQPNQQPATLSQQAGAEGQGQQAFRQQGHSPQDHHPRRAQVSPDYAVKPDTAPDGRAGRSHHAADAPARYA